MSDERKRELWDAIAEYVAACGGRTDQTNCGMMQGVRLVETAVLGVEVDTGANLKHGVRTTGGIYPDWVYEAREAIRRQNENPPDFLKELCVILGWQGGTIHQALTAVRRLIECEKERERRGALEAGEFCPRCEGTGRHWNGAWQACSLCSGSGTMEAAVHSADGMEPPE